MEKPSGVGWAGRVRRTIAAAVLVAVLALPGVASARTIRWQPPSTGDPVVVEPIVDQPAFTTLGVSWS